jgi:hypothetical protein
MAWQSSRVNVLTTADGQLEIYERQEGAVIACHPLSQGKGEVIKNRDHYRDKTKQIADLEKEIAESLGSDLGPRICHQLKQTDPCYYKDKLRGVKRHLARLAALPDAQLAHLADKEVLKVSTLVDYLSAWEANPERMKEVGQPVVKEQPLIDRSGELACYEELTQQEASHELH